VLSNPDKRAIYDQAGEEGLQGGGEEGGPDMSDLFGSIFGGGGGGRGKGGPRKGKNIDHLMKVDLEAVYKGKTLKVGLSRQALRARASGSSRAFPPPRRWPSLATSSARPAGALAAQTARQSPSATTARARVCASCCAN
jgi:DnaJ-class molecular chaperone